MIHINYSSYQLNIKEYIIYGLAYILMLGIVSFLFYDSLIPILIFSPGLMIYYNFISVYLCEHRKKQLVLQFRDMINSISVSLSSGYSIENAINEAYGEMLVLYGDASLICEELRVMLNKLSLCVPIETIFLEFAKRSFCDDIHMFAQILVIAKRNGGDLISIIKNSSETIGEKIDIKREIFTAISSKLFEQYIMFVMPPAIMGYIRISSPDYFQVVYHNLLGIVLMSICLALYIFSIILGLKFTTIKI